MSFFVRRLRAGFSDSSISCSKRWMSERSVTSWRCSRTVVRRNADDFAVDIQLIGQDPFFGPVELIGKTIDKMVERLDHVPGNQSTWRG